MYRLNDEQQRIAATAAAVADRELAPRAAGVDRDAAFPERLDRGARRERAPRPDGAEGARRARTGSADGRRRHRRRGAAMPVDRDGLPDAPVRRRLLRRRAGQDGAAARGRGRRTPPLDARLQREGIAQPLLGAGEPRQRLRQRRRVDQRAEVVRHLGRPRRRLRRLDAGGRRDAAARELDLPRPQGRRGRGGVGSVARARPARQRQRADDARRTCRSAPTARSRPTARGST